MFDFVFCKFCVLIDTKEFFCTERLFCDTIALSAKAEDFTRNATPE